MQKPFRFTETDMAAADEHALLVQAASDATPPAALFASAVDAAPSTRNPLPTAAVRRAIALHASLVRTTLARETAVRLVAGGDARIALGDDDRNRYGCGAEPDAGLFAFGSSTASVVSAPGFAAARALTARLLIAPGRTPFELAAMRADILALTGAAAVAGTQLIVAASGTDLHLIAAHLSSGGESLGSVTVESSETGTGVLPALAIQHFSGSTSGGRAVQASAPLAGGGPAQVHTVRLRHADGSPRDAADIDADYERLVDTVVASGSRGLLSLTDLTKTGMLAPSPACAIRLLERHAGRLDVLVDACQFRIAPATVRDYLERGFMVAVTGSKFVTGPAFCGALLLPPRVAKRVRDVPLGLLADYTVRSDWPVAWRAAEELGDALNIGLMTRWCAALAELRRFRALSDVVIARDLEAFANAVSIRIETDPAFEAVSSPAIDRGMSSGTWDEIPTLFSFIVHRPDGADRRVPLTTRETATLHAQMCNPAASGAHRDDASRAVARMRFQLGQPVAVGTRHHDAVSALRISASARTIVDGAAHVDGIAPAIRQAMRAFDKLASLAGWPR